MPLGIGHRMESEETLALDGDDLDGDAQPVAPAFHFGGDAPEAVVGARADDAAMVPVVAGVPGAPNAPDAPDAPDAPIAPAPRRVAKKKLTSKEKAANGAHRIGPWTRQRILCPHQPTGTMDIWVPEYGVMCANFTKSLCDTMDNFEKGRHGSSSFYMLLVVDIFLFGWWVVWTVISDQIIGDSWFIMMDWWGQAKHKTIESK